MTSQRILVGIVNGVFWVTGAHMWLLKVRVPIISTCGPYNLEGAVTAGIRASVVRVTVALLFKTSK